MLSKQAAPFVCLAVYCASIMQTSFAVRLYDFYIHGTVVYLYLTLCYRLYLLYPHYYYYRSLLCFWPQPGSGYYCYSYAAIVQLPHQSMGTQPGKIKTSFCIGDNNSLFYIVHVLYSTGM